MRQSTSVSKYIQQFRDVVVELGVAAPSAENLLFLFIEGLKPSVKKEILLQQPNNLDSAMTLADRCDNVVFNNRSVGSHTPMELGYVNNRSTYNKNNGRTAHASGRQQYVHRNADFNPKTQVYGTAINDYYP